MSFYHAYLTKGKMSCELCGECFIDKKDAIAYAKQELKRSQVEDGILEFDFIEYTSYKIVSRYEEWD